MEAAGKGKKAGPHALEARDLTLSWDGQLIVAERVSLHVDAGELCCLVGRSGSGKTTLLHTLSGLERPLAGRVFVRDRDITGAPGQVSYMLQKDLLLPHLRVIDNVALPLTLGGMPAREARAQAFPLFARFGLAGTERSWPAQLSGGMRQRAALLRTYLTGAGVVLLDEPFSALDALTRADMRHWFCEMVAELDMAALVITHDVDEAALMASRVYVLAGNPAAGRPSHVVAEVPNEPTGSEDFALTGAFLATKGAVLAALAET